MNNSQELPQLGGKVIVVTGGAGQLGRAFCLAIAASKGVAVIADTSIESAKKVAEEICKLYSGGAIAVEMNITCKDSICRSIDYVHRQFGVINAVVNNAYPRNTNYGRRVEEVTYEDFCENVGMHAGGYFLVMQQFAGYFRRQGHGNIVNMSSIYGVIAPHFDVYESTSMTMPVEYAAIKSGVVHLTKYFAQYLKGANIRVNAISPGGILNQQPDKFLNKYRSYCGSKGMLNEEDVVGSLLFLLSDSSLYLTGQNIVVDDGFSL